MGERKSEGCEEEEQESERERKERRCAEMTCVVWKFLRFANAGLRSLANL